MVRQSVQRTFVNTTCKLLLLTHAFETPAATWWAGTDNFNFANQRAIERLGAKNGGDPGHALRRDGTIRVP